MVLVTSQHCFASFPALWCDYDEIAIPASPGQKHSTNRFRSNCISPVKMTSTAIVTGANSGIGHAFAKILVKEVTYEAQCVVRN